MRDEDKSREQLLEELQALRARLGGPTAVCAIAGENPCREVEEELEQSRQRLRAVFENSLDGMILMDDTGRYVDVNPSGCEMLGYTREELLRLTVFDVTPPESRAPARALLGQFLTAGTLSGEYTVVCKNGSRRHLEFRSVANILPGLHLGVHRDVTERMRREEELRRQKEVLQTIFDHIPVMIELIDPHGQVQLVNREWERVLGWSLEDARQRDVFAEIYPDPAEKERVAQYILNPPPGWADFRTRARDGRTIDTSWANVLLSDGTSMGFGQDVTERKQAEQALERYAIRLQSLSQRLVDVQEEERRHLARELHDEIGQLLTSLKFAIEGGASEAERLAEARELIADALARVRTLASDLRPALLDHLGLVPALRSLIARYTAGTGVRVSFNGAGLGRRFAARVETAAYRIVQEALTNVARHARVDEAAVRVWVDADRLQVQVEDEGVGFDADTALAGGHSSGLPGMQERVMLLGGRLAVESVPGGGTHLMAELPLNGEEGGAG